MNSKKVRKNSKHSYYANAEINAKPSKHEVSLCSRREKYQVVACCHLSPNQYHFVF